MWELDYKESWTTKNWFWTVVLEKILESPLDCKEIQPVHAKGDQSSVFIGKTDVEAETPIFWPPDVNLWLIWKESDVGKDWRQEEKGTTEDEIVRWHHQLNGHGFGWTPGVVEAEAWILWPPDAKRWLIRKDPDARKDWGQEEKGVTEDEMTELTSLDQWTWVWESYRRWWWRGKPGMLQSMGSQRVRQD